MYMVSPGSVYFYGFTLYIMNMIIIHHMHSKCWMNQHNTCISPSHCSRVQLRSQQFLSAFQSAESEHCNFLSTVPFSGKHRVKRRFKIIVNKITQVGLWERERERERGGGGATANSVLHDVDRKLHTGKVSALAAAMLGDVKKPTLNKDAREHLLWSSNCRTCLLLLPVTFGLTPTQYLKVYLAHFESR